MTSPIRTLDQMRDMALRMQMRWTTLKNWSLDDEIDRIKITGRRTVWGNKMFEYTKGRIAELEAMPNRGKLREGQLRLNRDRLLKLTVHEHAEVSENRQRELAVVAQLREMCPEQRQCVIIPNTRIAADLIREAAELLERRAK